MMRRALVVFVGLATAGPAVIGTAWAEPPQLEALTTLAATAPPSGFERVQVEEGSFAAFLRRMPLRPRGTPVLAYDGERILPGDDPRVFRVAALEIGTRDLQQCADSVIRWHAEWLWSQGAADRASYHFVSGDLASFERYRTGERPVVDGPRVRWVRRAKPRRDRATFREFLDVVFTYASTVSLAREARLVAKQDLAPGDFFVVPGGPGHAVLVLDVARDPHGRSVALLGQGYMPAQDFHVLASGERGLGPWFSLEVDALETPFWPAPFRWSQLRRFR